jgi:Phycobilisome protein
MHPQIEAIFDDADSRYLKVEELKLAAQYFGSIPARLAAYRSLRDHELEITQWVADQLQAEMPQETTENLERSLKNALLMLRHCGMAMLLSEETIVKERFLNWVVPMVEVYNTQAIDSRLYLLLNQRLDQVLGKHMALLSPVLLMAQNVLLPQPAEPVNGVAIGW